VTPHVAQNTTPRRSAMDGRTTRHAGYAVSGRLRKRIEEVFGWTKAAPGFRKTRHRGLARVGWMFTLTAAAYNLVRLPKLAVRGIAMSGICPEMAIPHNSGGVLRDEPDIAQRMGETGTTAPHFYGRHRVFRHPVRLESIH
jgi:hypothetical protein